MPQMSPLSWLILFFMFTITFIYINMINYFTFLYQSKKYSLKLNKLSINWKW